jgi:UDP-perosamine 4-acetyltransferase
MPPLILIGAGGHARVVIEAFRAMGGFRLVGLLDPRPPAATVLGLEVLGDEAILPRLRREGIAHAFVALGANALRLRLGAQLEDLGFVLPAAIHPAACVSPTARVEPGAVVMARAVLGTEGRAGRLAILNTGAVVDHDGNLGAACHVAPGCALAGNVSVGERALVGVGSAVRPGISIGADAVVGAGSAVVKDVPAGATVAGTPARPLGTA